MASPISFGDAFLMASLAFKLAKAFTKGRKSAPAEFREVENQLYSLTAALTALKEASDAGRAAMVVDQTSLPPLRSQMNTTDGPRDMVTTMLENCNETLKHLEKIVEKYGLIMSNTDPSKPRLKRWSQDLLKNWKKIYWTTEKGDLNALRSELMVHVNSLNLVMGIIINSQTTRIENELDQSASMLKEIYHWYVDNLKNAAPKTNPKTPRFQTDSSLTRTRALVNDSSSVERDITFEIHVESVPGTHTLVCPHARLDHDWNKDEDPFPTCSFPGPAPLFTCQCSELTSGSVHQAAVAAFGLSRFTLPFRMVGNEKSWMLYKAADQTSQRLVNVVIKNVATPYTAEFEDNFICPLVRTRAMAMLGEGMSNMLTYPVSDANGRVLCMLGDLSRELKSLDSVLFKIGHQSYARDKVTSLTILQYQPLHSRDHGEVALPRTKGLRLEIPLSYAEIAVCYDEADAQTRNDVAKHTLLLQESTKVSLAEQDAVVTLNGVNVVGYHNDGTTNQKDGLDVSFQFTDSTAMRPFHGKIKEMQFDLFVMSLEFPTPDESSLLQLEAIHVQCEEIYIQQARLTIVRNIEGQYRLIIVSHNKCTILSQILAEDFFVSRTENDALNFSSPTHVVQVDTAGKRTAHRYEHGFQHMTFKSPEFQAERMIELARHAISPPTTLPLRLKY